MLFLAPIRAMVMSDYCSMLIAIGNSQNKFILPLCRLKRAINGPANQKFIELKHVRVSHFVARILSKNCSRGKLSLQWLRSYNIIEGKTYLGNSWKTLVMVITKMLLSQVYNIHLTQKLKRISK